MVLGAVVMEAVTPDLLFFGQNIAVARHDVERIGLVVGTPVGIEIVAVLVPDVGVLEEKGIVGGHVVDHRIAFEFVLVVAHFHAVDGDQLLRIGIVVTPDRFEQVLAVQHHAAVVELADVAPWC